MPNSNLAQIFLIMKGNKVSGKKPKISAAEMQTFILSSL